MASQIYVNLPVKDLKRSLVFFTRAVAAGATTPNPAVDAKGAS